MSDNESSYASDSDSDISENEQIVNKPSNNIIKKKQSAPTIDNFDDDSEEEEQEDEDEDIDDVDNDVDNEEIDDLSIQIGGVKEIDNDDDSESEKEEDEDEDITESPNKKTKKSAAIKKTVNIPMDSDDEDEDEEFDDNYLQKFDNEITKNYVHEFHPECLQHNYDEVAKMSVVIRDSSNIIVDPFHKTIPYLTKYERARILGQRAKQIESGAKPLVKVPENVIDGYIIAELELQQKRIPFIIRRPIPGGAFEYWNLKDLEIIAF